MALRLITGAANAGKTGIVLATARSAAAAGASPTVVVPSLAEARRFEGEFAEVSHMGIRVATHAEFVGGLWGLWGDGRRLVDRHARAAVMAEVIAEGVGPHLAPLANTPGLPRLLTRIAATNLEFPGHPHDQDELAAEVGALLVRYRLALEARGLTEPVWAQGHLALFPPELPGPVGFMRFDGLSTADVRFVLGLASRNEVDVALTWEAKFAPTRANDVAVASLASGATDLVHVPEQAPVGEIAELARALYGGPAAVVSRGDVLMGLASGAEAEAALVAEFVSGCLVDGVPAERVVVAFPDASAMAAALRPAFRSAGIPYAFDGAMPLVRTAFGRAFMGLIGWASGAGDATSAMTYIASIYSSVDSVSAHAAERQLRRSRSADPARYLRRLIEDAGAGGHQVGIACRACEQGLSARTVGMWLQLTDGLLSRAADARHPSEEDALRVDAAASQVVSDTLVAMAQVHGASFTAAQVLRALGDARVRPGSGEHGGRVQICDFGDVGSRRFDVVVLGGLTDRQVTTRSQEPPEAELGFSSEVASAQGDLRRLHFYTLVSRARKRLFLTRQESDSEGRELRSSALWDDVLDAYRRGTAAGEQTNCPPTGRIARAQIERLAPALTVGRKEERGAGGRTFRRIARSRVTGDAAAKALAGVDAYSPTQVETYLRCAYLWFYSAVVRPREIDSEYGARELGSLAHGILAEFYRRWSSGGARERVTSASLPRALALFDEIARAAAKTADSGSVSDALEVARAMAWARRVVTEDAYFLPGFAPARVEVGFGEGASFRFADVAFRGRIDRIDTCTESAFVSDYKTSREVPGVARFEQEGRVQAVVYALAAEAACGLPASGSVYRSMTSGRSRGFWRRDLLGEAPYGMREDDGIDEEQFTRLVSATEQRVASAVEGMRAGRIDAIPRVKGACSWCPIRALCEGATR